MALIEYYEKEIRYFLEEAQRFAAAHPDQARALNLENVRYRDPYAERLIEAFAFLAGSVNQRIDDDFSNLAQELIHLVWPHYMQPLPSAVIMEVTPTSAADILGGFCMEKGAIVASGPVSTGSSCRFTTCGDVMLRPLLPETVLLKSLYDGRTSLQIGLSPMAGGIDWEEMDRRPLSFYLHGEPGFAFSLYYMLLTDIILVRVTWQENGEKRSVDLPPDALISAVSNPAYDIPLLPYPQHSFPGFRLLEEYFSFPDKFRFVHMDVLSAIGMPDDNTPITLDLILSGQEHWRIEPTPKNFRLNCIPAINQFPEDVATFILDDSSLEHRVVVNRRNINHHIPHDVISVKGLNMETNERRDYQSFVSYRQEAEPDAGGYYQLKRQIGVDDNPEVIIKIVRTHPAGSESMSITAMCGNDQVVEEVRLGDIRQKAKGLPNFVKMSNLTVPQPPAWPHFSGEWLWPLINSLGLNHLTLKETDQIKNVLKLYDRLQTRANRRRIDGITSVKTKAADRIINGYPLRGMTMDMILAEENFLNRGDLFLFSGVMSAFMSMYVAINSFCQLNTTEERSGIMHTFPELPGDQAII